MLEEAEKENKSEELSSESKQTTSSSRRILSDGTYATETAFSSNSLTLAKLEAVKVAVKLPLRCNMLFFINSRNLNFIFNIALLLSGNFYLGSVLASTLTKLVLRYAGVSNDPKKPMHYELK